MIPQDHFKDSLCNPLALINDVFKDLVDAILVHVGSPRKQVLDKAVDDALEIFQANKLYAKFWNSVFWLKQVSFLCHAVFSEVLSMDSQRLKLLLACLDLQQSTWFIVFLG